MRDSQVYLAELRVAKCKLAQPTNTKIGLIFRMGKTIIQSSTYKVIEDGNISFDTTLQLNIDRAALETQRCSVTLTYANGTPEGGIAGIALITIPKQRCIPLKTYKLVQCKDKTAHIELSLKIIPLDENHSASPRTSSSFCSIMEMNDFEKKTISPPKLFTSSDISDRSHHFKHLMPPKPRMSRERQVNPLTISIHSQVIEEDRIITLQNECNCLKKLLRIQIAKNKECSAMIDKLLDVLQNGSTCCLPNELDETLLIDKSEYAQPIVQVKKEKSDGQAELEDIKIRNRLLMQQNKQLEELVFKLSDMVERNADQKQKSQSWKELQKEANQYKMNYFKLKSEIQSLVKDLLSMQQELEIYKLKIKLQSKFPSLRQLDFEKGYSDLATIRRIMERQVAQKQQMIKILVRPSRGQNEAVPRVNLWVRIRQKIDRTFSNLVSKKLNKDILNYQKGELLKILEECVLHSNKNIQY